ncbi:hypothetical protein H5410_022365 [Solanum commersonii]|uniref:Uncharacterized protein n=1 Tax=Solanum commersonii TaxID=4109 RepID=A0A9J5ZHT7_SOLCO|nr:hypothetical protein H5410_022365 [Solanum commersonii]
MEEKSLLEKKIGDAIDHIINSTIKSNYIYVGQSSVPIIFRSPNSVVEGFGAQHSQIWNGVVKKVEKRLDVTRSGGR